MLFHATALLYERVVALMATLLVEARTLGSVAETERPNSLVNEIVCCMAKIGRCPPRTYVEESLRGVLTYDRGSVHRCCLGVLMGRIDGSTELVEALTIGSVL